MGGYLFDKKILIAYILVLFSFLIGSPYWLLDFPAYSQGFSESLAYARWGRLFAFSSAPQMDLIRAFIAAESSSGILFIAAMVYALLRPSKKRWLLLVFILSTFLMIGKVAAVRTYYLLPVFPALAILGGSVLADIGTRWGVSKNKGYLSYVIAFLVLLHPAIKILNYDRMLLGEDTRALAKQWIEEHIPAGAKIAMENTERYGAYPQIVSQGTDFDTLDYGPRARETYVSAGLKKLLEGYFTRNKTYRIYSLEKDIELTMPAELKHKGYAQDIYLKAAYSKGWRDLSELKKQGIEYIVLSAATYEYYFGANAPAAENPVYPLFLKNKAYFSELLHSKELVLIKEFSPGANILGPALKVFKVIY